MSSSSYDISNHTFNVVDCYYTFIMNVKVSNRPLKSGNTCAELEIFYKSTDYDAVDKVFYIEHGINPIRKYIGSNVVWDNEIDTSFCVLV